MSAGRYPEAGARVRAARRAKGWRQWELARKAGVPLLYVSTLENGHEPPTGMRWTAVADALGLKAGQPAPAATPAEALPAHPPVRWNRDISRACDCEWEITTGEDRRVAGWRVAVPRPGCTAMPRGAAA